MSDIDEEDRVHARRTDDAVESIYSEDGSVRADFLAMVGAAIADRDVLFLRQNVIRLHETELGHLLEVIQPDQRQALVRLLRSEEHTSELHSLMRTSYTVFCLKKKKGGPDQ